MHESSATSVKAQPPTDWDDVTNGDPDAYTAVGEALNARYAPLPVGTTTSSYWGHADANGIRERDLHYWELDADDSEAYVHVGGTQYSDGRIAREITVWLDDKNTGAMTAAGARGLAAALIAAADTMDEWAQR